MNQGRSACTSTRGRPRGDDPHQQPAHGGRRRSWDCFCLRVGPAQFVSGRNCTTHRIALKGRPSLLSVFLFLPSAAKQHAVGGHVFCSVSVSVYANRSRGGQRNRSDLRLARRRGLPSLARSSGETSGQAVRPLTPRPEGLCADPYRPRAPPASHPCRVPGGVKGTERAPHVPHVVRRHEAELHVRLDPRDGREKTRDHRSFSRDSRSPEAEGATCPSQTQGGPASG